MKFFVALLEFINRRGLSILVSFCLLGVVAAQVLRLDEAILDMFIYAAAGAAAALFASIAASAYIRIKYLGEDSEEDN